MVYPKTPRRLFTIFFFTTALALAALCGCASDDQGRNSAPPDDFDVAPRRAPASYFIDRFQVKKDLPEHSTKNNKIPFFFKKCNIAGSDWQDHQNYQCDVAF